MITDDIIKWIHTLAKWQQTLALLILEKKRVYEDELSRVYHMFKVEMSLEEGDIPEEDTKEYASTEDITPTTVWIGIDNVHGVNRLRSGSCLDVSDGLTVIYGENGSGKSGYTRLLNNAFISRGDREILPNIFSDEPDEISAEFKFLVNGEETVYKYPESKNSYPFKTIRNFDAKSETEDMHREAAIDFAPEELSFFDTFLSACTAIQKKLDEEREQRKTDNPLLKYFPDDGIARSRMLSLSASTEIDDIKNAFSYTKKEQEYFEEIKKKKARLIALDISGQIRIIGQVMDALTDLQKRFALFEEAVSEENIELYNQQIGFLRACRESLEQNGIALFKNDDIELLGKDVWYHFIKAAKNYYDNITGHDNCPLCGQKIRKDDLIWLIVHISGLIYDHNIAQSLMPPVVVAA